jgi:YidC/Oxa1 family membrane protein insertase
MFFQQKLSTAQSKYKGPLTEQQKQQQKMGTIMTIVFTVLFYNFPSGLNIYWLSSMALAVVQQLYASKRMQKKALSPKEIVVKPKKK